MIPKTTKASTPEHTPGPQFNRAVYGFSFYLIFHCLFLIYLVWAFVPDEIFSDVFHLTYLPDKYFALYIPILILVAVNLFAFLVYPAINMSLTPNLDSQSTVSDPFSIRRCWAEMCTNPVPKSSGNDEREMLCDFHKENGLIMQDDGRIAAHCDCMDEEKCLLKTDPNHLQELRAQRKMPTVGDLDIVDVSNVLYGS